MKNINHDLQEFLENGSDAKEKYGFHIYTYFNSLSK